MGYDLLGRLTSVTDPLNRTTTHRYDELGNRIETVNGAGDRVERQFDARGLLTRRIGTNAGQANASVDDVFGYDALGRQVLAQSLLPGGSTRSFGYDALDRAVSVSDGAGSGSGFGTARRVFDADGRVAQLVHPTNAFPAGVVTNYYYDGRNQLIGILDPEAGLWQLGYDAAGRLVRRTDAAGYEYAIHYTPEQYLDSVDVHDAAGAVVDSVSFGSYDALGNAGSIVRSGSAAGTTLVAYDELSRVKEVRYPGGGALGSPCATECEVFQGLTRKVVGRRITRSAGGVSTTYGYDALSRLTLYHNPSQGSPMSAPPYYRVEGKDESARSASRSSASAALQSCSATGAWPKRARR